MKRWKAACIFVAFLLPAPLQAAELKTESFTLANGLEVIVIPNHRIPAISHMLWFRIGAGDDPAGKSGLAHYHEHMMFEGTPRYKAGEYASLINQNGGQQNAFTGHDATAYYVNIAKEKLPLVMALEADRMHSLSATPQQAGKEKQVIIEERRMRIENNPAAMLDEQMNAALFRNHPYHWPVIGWMHEMEELKPADVLSFHDTWYHPNNAILIVSGDITAAELKPLAQKYYGDLKAKPVPPRHWNDEPPQNAPRRVSLRHANVQQPSFSRSYATASLSWGKKQEALPLFVTAQMLGGGKTSRLYQKLVVEQKLAASVDANYNGFSMGPGMFDISAVPQNGVSLEKLEAAIDREISAFLSEKPSASDIARAKTLIKAESIYALDSLTEMARIMGWLRILGMPSDYFTRWPEMIDAVTPEQITTAATDTLAMNQSVTGWLLPEEQRK